MIIILLIFWICQLYSVVIPWLFLISFLMRLSKPTCDNLCFLERSRLPTPKPKMKIHQSPSATYPYWERLSNSIRLWFAASFSHHQITRSCYWRWTKWLQMCFMNQCKAIGGPHVGHLERSTAVSKKPPEFSHIFHPFCSAVNGEGGIAVRTNPFADLAGQAILGHIGPKDSGGLVKDPGRKIQNKKSQWSLCRCEKNRCLREEKQASKNFWMTNFVNRDGIQVLSKTLSIIWIFNALLFKNFLKAADWTNQIWNFQHLQL